jgi:glucokinase
MVAAPAPGGDLAIGVDVGGTKLASGVVTRDGTVLARARHVTPAHDGAATMRLIAEVATAHVRDRGPGSYPVGVGAAGTIDLTGRVRYAPNIRWVDYPLQEELTARLRCPVTVDNDANVAAWGEFRCGAGRDARTSLVMLTIGTGVGGGLVLDGRLVRGATGQGAEFGHLIVAEGGPRCPCGNLGCLEALASGTAIGRMAAEAAAAGRVPTSSALHGVVQPTGKDVTVAAQAGDVHAVELLAKAGFWLGVGIASLVNACDPEIVVVGGGAMQAGELLLRPARAAAADRVLGNPARPAPPIVAARLGDDAGIVGAALLALDAV